MDIMPNAIPLHGPLVAALLYDGLCTFEFGIVAEIFGLERPECGENWYRFASCATEAGPLRAAGGLTIQASHGADQLEQADLIVVPGWKGIDVPVPDHIVNILQAAHRRGTRIASICSGAFVLAAAGLLDGRRATTHWRYAGALLHRYPAIAVDPNVLYVQDGTIFTSAGSAAGMDLLLHIVREDFGAGIANTVARRLVMPAQRDGGQVQFIEAPIPKVRPHRLSTLLDDIRSRLGEQWPIERMAATCLMSRRTFVRRFREATGLSPGEWLLATRLESAKLLLSESEASVSDIVEVTGFMSVDTLRHHFRVRLGISPGEFRRRFAPLARAL